MRETTAPTADLIHLIKDSCKSSLIAAAVFSGVANLLMLVPAFFMLNVYDKALGSNSLSTLAVLCVLTAVMFLGLAAMEAMRSRILVAIGVKIDRLFGDLVYHTNFQGALKVGSVRADGWLLRDLSNLRQFISTTGAITVFDIPWLPVYLFVMFLFHPMLGWMGVCASLIMVGVAVLNQRATTTGLAKASALSQDNMGETDRHFKNAEVAASMGMLEPMQKKWRLQQDKVVAMQADVSNVAGAFNATIKTLRLAIQSSAIALGALLVLEQEISPGMLIAGSILVGRALQPIELAVGAWRGFVDAKGQYQRLAQAFSGTDWSQDTMALPSLRGAVSSKNAAIKPPGSKTTTVTDATFEILSGTTCMVIGPSGAGKSTLVRGILGIWPTSAGAIRIDGAEAAHYDRAEIGSQIGYLPQDIELFEGTVSVNIARLGEVDATAVVLAAEDAGIHEFILSLPDGYDTQLGKKSGLVLSPGQRQRIALARAMYGRPKLVILDEPNSNLDQIGEKALNRAIEILKQAASTVIIVSHRPGAMALADQLLAMSAGVVVESGPPEAVMAFLSKKIDQDIRPQQSEQPPKSKRRTPTIPI